MAHWYCTERTPDGVPGEPRHKQPLKRPAKDGRTTTDTTLRHARVQYLAPSVNGVSDFRAKHQLNRWQRERLFDACVNQAGLFSHINDRTFDNVKATVFAEYEAIVTKDRDEGTRLHDLINKAFEGKYPQPAEGDDWEIVYAATSTALKLREEHGGRVIVDFKTTNKSEEEFEDLKLWDDHHIQLAAYREMLRTRRINKWESEVPYVHPLGFGGTVDFVAEATPNAVTPKTHCFIVYLNTRHPGQVKVVQSSDDELDLGWEQFKALLVCWKLFNSYDASY